MKNKLLKYIVYSLFVLVVVLGCYFIIKDANWIFGDDHEFLVSTAIGKIESIKTHMGGGRFNPIQHYDYNILTLIPFGSTVYAHYVFVALSFALLSWLFAKNSYLISKTYLNSSNKIWGVMLFSCLCFFAFLINPNVAAVFLDVIFPERLLLILFAGFVYFYITAMKQDEKWRYICALLCAVYATYMKEVVAGAFLAFAITNLLFSYKNISRTKKQFYMGLIVNFIIYLALYYVFVFRTSSKFYNDGVSGLTYFDNIVKIFNQQKFLIPVFIFAIYRLVRILAYKDYKHLPFDALLFMSVAYTGQYFILNLNSGYYFNPSVLLGYFVMFYWLVCNFDAKKWRLAIALLCLISVGCGYQDVLRKYKYINMQRNSFMPTISKLVEQYNGPLKMYTRKQGTFNDTLVKWQAHVLNVAINYVKKQNQLNTISFVFDDSELKDGDVVLISEFESANTRNQLDNLLLKKNDLFKENNKALHAFIYTNKKMLPLGKGVYHLNKEDANIIFAGYYFIEPWGRWTDSEKAYIKFMVPERKDFKLKFDIPFAFVAKQRPYQKITVSVNNKKKALWTFEYEKPKPQTTIDIKRSDIGTDNIVSVEFDIENPVSPKEYGISADYRKLAIGVKSFEIME